MATLKSVPKPPRQLTEQATAFIRGEVTFTDTTTPVYIGSFGSATGKGLVNKATSGAYIAETFNAVTTNQIQIGTLDAAGAFQATFGSALDATTKDFVPLDVADNLEITAVTDVYALANLVGGSESQGRAIVIMEFSAETVV